MALFMAAASAQQFSSRAHDAPLGFAVFLNNSIQFFASALVCFFYFVYWRLWSAGACCGRRTACSAEYCCYSLLLLFNFILCFPLLPRRTCLFPLCICLSHLVVDSALLYIPLNS